MDPFSISAIPSLHFGTGTFSRLIHISRQSGIKKPLFITGESFLDKCGFWNEVEKMFNDPKRIKIHTEPSDFVIDNAVQFVKNNKCDSIIGIGGGSVIDTAKAVSAMALEDKNVINYLEGVGTLHPSGKRLPLIAVPTSSGTGAEVTKNAVISRIGGNGFKKSLRHENYIPDFVIIDSNLLIHAPFLISVAAGMDAYTQLLEAYVSVNSSAFTDTLALEGLKLLSYALPLMVLDPGNHQIRLEMAYSAWLSGIVLANAGLGVVHGFASEAGSVQHIPHGIVCATLLMESTKEIIENLDINKDDISIRKYANAGALFNEKKESSIKDNLNVLIKTLTLWQNEFKIPPLSTFGITEEDCRKIAEKTSIKKTPVLLTKKQLFEILLKRL